MGLAQSKNQDLSEHDLLTVIDFMASKYMLSPIFEEMNNLKDRNYCNNLVIITSDLLEKNFTSKEIDYIYSKKYQNGDLEESEETEESEESKESDTKEFVINKTLSTGNTPERDGGKSEESDEIEDNMDDEGIDKDEEYDEEDEDEDEDEEQDEDEEEDEEHEEEDEEEDEEDEDEEEDEEDEEEEDTELYGEEVYFGTKKDFKKFSKDVKDKNKYKCIGLAKFYVKIAHIFATIMTSVNPVYEYQEEGSSKKIKKKLKDMKSEKELPLNIKPIQSGLCDSRIKMLQKNLEYLTKINEENKDVDTVPSTDQTPHHCKSSSKKLDKEPGIPELEVLYFDVYDYSKGAFNEMSTEMRKKYNADLISFYEAFTGKEFTDDNGISKFSDISLIDYKKSDYCNANNGYGVVVNDSLLTKYAKHISDTIERANNQQKLLIQVIDKIFGFTDNRQEIMIRPELNYEGLGIIVEETRKIIIDLYSTCEEDFQNGINLFEAMVELKTIQFATEKAEAAKEAAFTYEIDSRV